MDKTVNFTCLLYSLQCKEKRYVPCSLFEFALNGKKFSLLKELEADEAAVGDKAGG